jgi:hypothetical protein
MNGDWPGVAPIKLTKEPLGTEGELTPGPDELNPAIPEQRDELVRRGYLSIERDEIGTVGGVTDAEIATDPFYSPPGDPFDEPPKLANPELPFL